MSASDPASHAPARHRRRCGLHQAPTYARPTSIYALCSLILIAVYPVLPTLGRTVDFLLVSCGAIGPATWVVGRRPRGHRGPWWLLLVALVVLNLGNLAWYWYVDVKHLPTADGTVSDALVSAGHVLLLLSALSVVLRRGRNDVGGMLDTAIVSVAAGGLLWDAVILPHLDVTNETAGARLSMFVDFLILTAILGALLRLLLTARQSVRALWLLILTLAFSMTGNVLVVLLLNPVTGERPNWTNMSWTARRS